MSHIVTSDESFKAIDDVFCLVKKEGLCRDVISYTLEVLLSNADGSLLIDYDVNDRLCQPTVYIPRYNKINVSVSGLIRWISDNGLMLQNEFNVVDKELFLNYLFLYALSHEIEHGYQSLISKKVISIPYSIVESGYRGLLQLFEKNDVLIPNPISDIRKIISLMLYKKDENMYVLERNANIESLDLVIRYALLRDDKKMAEVFEKMQRIFKKAGYFDSCCGSFEDTYKKILMYDKYKKFNHEYEMSDSDRVRYGLPISDDIRQKILSLK